MISSYRISADAIHLLAFFILLCKLWIYKSAAGASAKTQILYTLVFTTRYLDLFTNSTILYNNVYKVAYLTISYVILISIYTKFRETYEKDEDAFRIEFPIIIALTLSFICNYWMQPLEIAWIFSEYLECMAIWPQLYMIMKTKKVRIGIFLYLLALGLYRIVKILYIENRIYTHDNLGYYDAISDVSVALLVIPCLTFWILCLIGVVRITGEKQSWSFHNLTENDQNSIFTIKLPSEKSTAPLLIDTVYVPDGWYHYKFSPDGLAKLHDVAKW